MITYTWESAADAGFTTNVTSLGTGADFTPGDADVGRYLRVTASYTDGNGTLESVTSSVTAAVQNVNDAPTGVVTIDDTTPTEDQQLTASDTLGDDDGLGTITYTWESASDAGFTTDITVLGTGANFTPGDAEVGRYLRVTASYTDVHGTAESVSSAVTAAVTNINDPATGTVTIDDTTPTEDQLLNASAMLTDGDGIGAITYTWESATDAGFTTDVTTLGTGMTFTPGDAEVGRYLRVTASYTDVHGTAESVASAVTAAVANVNDPVTGSVTIDDTTPTEDQELTASNTLADDDGLGAITYTWESATDAGFTTDVTVIGTGSTFTPGDAESGRYLRVTASYTDVHGTPESVTSAVTAAVENINDPVSGSVTIDDTAPIEEQLLTASNTLVDDDGLGAITYTWESAADAGFTTDVTVLGTGATFTPDDAEVGRYLRVTASYTDVHGTAESVTSAVTAAVVNVNDAPTGEVTIDDSSPTEGQVLTVSDTLADDDGLGAITYTWESAADAGFTTDVVTEGTGSTFTPADTEVGRYLRVTASYTDGHGTSESVASAVTGAVAALIKFSLTSSSTYTENDASYLYFTLGVHR